MEKKLFRVENLEGGLVDGVHASDLRESEADRLVNFYPFGGKLVRRRGCRKTGLQAGAQILGLHAFSFDSLGSEVYRLIAGVSSGFLADDGSESFYSIADDGEPYVGSGLWSIAQHDSEAWATRPGEPIRRVTLFEVAKAGIEAPEDTMAAAEGAAGELSQGSYRYFVTFETSTGNMSVPSAEIEVTLAGTSKVELSTIPVSSQARVSSRVLWRTSVDDAGQAYFLARIEDNSTTTYTDNTPNESLGDPFDYNLIDPPEPTNGWKSLCSWKERLWAHDGSVLYCTKPGLFETWEQSFESFGPDIVGVFPWDDRLIVATRTKVFYVSMTGVDEAGARFDVNALTLDHGCTSHHSIQSAEGRLFWFSGENVYMSDGSEVVSISNVAIRKAIDNALAAGFAISFAKIDAHFGWYMLSLATDSASSNGIVLCYNWRSGKWHTFSYLQSGLGLMASADIPGDDGLTRYASMGSGGIVYELEVGDRDGYSNSENGDAIVSTFRGKSFSSSPSMMILRKVHAHISVLDPETAPEPSSECMVTFRLYGDGSADAMRERSVDILSNRQRREWSRVGLSGGHGSESDLVTRLKAIEMQVELEYSGTQAIEVIGFGLEADTFNVAPRAI